MNKTKMELEESDTVTARYSRLQKTVPPEKMLDSIKKR